MPSWTCHWFGKHRWYAERVPHDYETKDDKVEIDADGMIRRIKVCRGVPRNRFWMYHYNCVCLKCGQIDRGNDRFLAWSAVQEEAVRQERDREHALGQRLLAAETRPEGGLALTDGTGGEISFAKGTDDA